MAGKASKKQVQTNLTVLSNLYRVTIPVVTLSLLRMLFLSSNKKPIKFILLHLPMFAGLYVIEKSGRPKYKVDAMGKKTIASEGLDLNSNDGNLVEYLFDLIYLSLFGDFGRILFDTYKFWYVLWVCPVYVGFKLYGLKQQFMGGGNDKKSKKSREDKKPAEEAKSKRQLKKEKRGDVKYKYR